MLKWYEKNNLKIYFSSHPKIIERYVCPCCSKEEKKSILKKPYENQSDLKIEIEYKNQRLRRKLHASASAAYSYGENSTFPPSPRLRTLAHANEKYSFTIPKGFCFDGASIPRIFWRLIGSNTDNTFLIAAMVHDFCCENHSAIGNNRYLSTLIFNALLEVGGVNPCKRWMMKHTVDNFQKFCGWKK